MTTFSGRRTPKRRGAVRLRTLTHRVLEDGEVDDANRLRDTPIVAAKSRIASAG